MIPSESGVFDHAQYNSVDTESKTLCPIIKLGNRETYNPERRIKAASVIVKAQPLLSKDGKSTTAIFDQIQKDGGIQNHLDFGGDVILSSIMPDRAIAGLTSEAYAELIEETGVKYYLTPDGETYLGETGRSAGEILRMLDQTQTLLDLCPRCVPIGLVKGCTSDQIWYHTDKLQNLGIQSFCFHLGDYFRGSDYVLQIAKRFANIIHEKTHELMIYGIGSKKHIYSFRFARKFATQSHIVKAYYGYKYEDGKWVKIPNRGINRDLIMHNLCAINGFVNDLNVLQGTQQELTPFLRPVDYVSLQKSTSEHRGVNYGINN